MAPCAGPMKHSLAVLGVSAQKSHLIFSCVPRIALLWPALFSASKLPFYVDI